MENKYSHWREREGDLSNLKRVGREIYRPKNKVRLRRKSALRVGLKKDIIVVWEGC
jgi:hypothetical protein